MEQSRGKQSIAFAHPPCIESSASVAGKKEGDGPLGHLIDLVDEDPLFGEDSWEKAESTMQKEAARIALKKAGLEPADIRYIFAGDLLGQLIATFFGMKELPAPLFGLYGACSTAGEALQLGAMTVNAGYASHVLCVASSHFGSAEKQFRYPLAYANQRPLSATWTVTGCGAFVVGTSGRVKITGITENYFMHYMYMSPALYESIYGNQPDFQEIFLDTTSSEAAFEDVLRTDYMQEEAVAAVSFLSGTSERVRDMLRSMDTLIYVLVISAGLLAFVVLFNLNHINITERRRELATLRVLGFYEEEVSRYVFRENVVLTVIGAGVGAGLGVLLHRFVIMTAEIDTMMFGRQIAGLSFVYSILLTFLFSGIVNVGMHVTLKKINMVESLKSVE